MKRATRASDRNAAAQSMDTSKPMSSEFIDAFMHVLERAEERGAWYAVEYWLASPTFSRIRKLADNQLLKRIVEWEGKLAKAREYEAIHGKNSLFLNDHPYNVALANRRRQRDENMRRAAAADRLNP